MSEFGALDQDLQQMFGDVFGDWREARGPAALEIELDRALWATLVDLGISRLTAVDGSGATWIEAAGLLRAAARTAAAVPVAENDVLSGWLREQAAIADDDLIHSACILDPSGSARAVPWASQVDNLTVLWPVGDGWKLADVPVSQFHVTPGRDLAGQPRDAVSIDLATLDGADVPSDVVREYRLRGALARSVQMAGALERIVELSVEHATSRVQFGRPIGKFQAVQNLIADAAGELVIANASTDAAVLALAAGEVGLDGLELRVAIARSVTGHAAAVIVRNVHQVHGAIGTTFEHQLHEFTKPVLAWRSEFGSLREWDTRLTELMVASELDLWAFGVPTDGR
ncbi:MAG: Acyl-CoA dehydrogenase [Microbacteriaceae bacterium]|nr:Acyl-CoA dehydrogenase [Microbacteriaceae bacterium]